MALRAVVLRHFRIPVQSLALAGGKSQPWSFSSSIRLMSSHDDHLSKEQVIERVLDVIKSFPKVDPSRVCPIIAPSFLFSLLSPFIIHSVFHSPQMWQQKRMLNFEIVLNQILIGASFDLAFDLISFVFFSNMVYLLLGS